MVQARRCLNRRCATRNERPGSQASAIDRHNVQPFGARSIVVVVELIEGRVIRTKGMTEKAVLGPRRRRRRVRPDVMRAFVVRDQYRAARNIRIVGMRKRDAAYAQADKEHERSAGTPDPRPTAEHRLSLPTTVGWRQDIGRLADWKIVRMLSDCGLAD
jgi:hypothetical protein